MEETKFKFDNLKEKREFDSLKEHRTNWKQMFQQINKNLREQNKKQSEWNHRLGKHLNHRAKSSHFLHLTTDFLNVLGLGSHTRGYFGLFYNSS